MVSYTWAKSLDTSTAIRNLGGDTLVPAEQLLPHPAKRGDQSTTCGTALSPALCGRLPFGKGRPVDIGNPVLNVVAGGWQMGGILTLQSGFAMTITNGLDTSNAGGLFDRPDSTGADAALPRGQQDPQRFFNTAAFFVNAPGTHNGYLVAGQITYCSGAD